MKTAAQLLCLILILFLFATNVYRAATQSITTDEAFTYNKFVWPELTQTLAAYDANHHVLHSLLCKVSVRCFGLSEFGLRVPSLAGGLLFLVSVWRLARYVFGRGWFCLFALAAVVLNPQVLDYLSAARGYSLALGFLFYGLFLLTRYLAEDYDPPTAVLFRAGLACGLSVAANLVFLVPVVAAAATFSAVVLVAPAASSRRERFWMLVDRFWGPAIVPAFIVLVLPLTHATARNFYYGASSLDEMVEHLVRLSLMHNLRVWSLARFLPRFADWNAAAAHFVVPALSLLILAAAAFAIVRWARGRDLPALRPARRAGILLAGTMALTLAALVVARLRFDVLYPLGRTGLYWLPLFTFGVLLAAAELWNAGRAAKLASAACVGAIVVAMALFLAGFTTNQYPEWRFDAGTRRIVDILRARPSGTPVRLGVNWRFEPSLNFYRHRYHLDWIQPVTRDGPDGAFDYYLLLPADAAVAERRALRPIYRDPVSEATLAVPSLSPAGHP
ncbi:MAG TPA: hypothetical protein VF767_01980 [Bryobacteraceae bacterium]